MKRVHIVSILVIIGAFLFAGLQYYIVFFGLMAQENDIADQIFTGLMATFSLAVAIIVTVRYIKSIKVFKLLPKEDSPEFQEALSKEDIMFEILRLENPNVDFSPKNMTFKELTENYKIEERFGNKNMSELKAIKNNLLQQNNYEG